ncbi:MAG: HlyD family secretion protein [Pseudomonadota bacterium]
MEIKPPAILTPTNIVALTILLVSTCWLAWWFVDRSHYVYVTDARISATMVNVSSRIPGWVEAFPPEEGDLVAPGDTLVRIDSRDTKMQLAEVEARLDTLAVEQEQRTLEMELAEKQINAAIEAERARVEAAQAALSEARVELQRTSRELSRAQSLLDQQMISNDDFEARESNHNKARETLHRREAELSTARAELLTAEANRARINLLAKSIEIARGERREVEIARQRLSNQLADHIIQSNIRGVVDETFINPGEYVYPGQRILMLHDPDNIWIKANIKETDIRNVHVGSPVEVSIDAYPDHALTGRVTQIGTSANSEFAMLPSPNPSGNFTKTTQRVGVRIDIDAGQVALKPGMMVELRIPVQDEGTSESPKLASQNEP